MVIYPKRWIKQQLQSIVAPVLPRLWHFRKSPTLVVLMYHRCLPEGHAARKYEQAGMFVSPETLQMHIEVLRKQFEIMHLDRWMSLAKAGARLPRFACALTFDDGWQDNYDFAFPVLRKLSAPATIYLVSDRVGATYSLWPTRIARVLRHASGEALKLLDRLPGPGGAPPLEIHSVPKNKRSVADVDVVIHELKTLYTDAELDDYASRLESVLSTAGGGVERDLLSWAEIRTMAASGLVNFGSHTRTHCRLQASLGPEAIEREVVGSADELEKHLGGSVAGFCYPNGDWCEAAVDTVRRRYSYAVTTSRGWNDRNTDPYLLRRIGFHDDVSKTPAAFLSRLGGIT